MLFLCAVTAIWLVGLIARRLDDDEVLLTDITERAIILGLLGARAGFVYEYASVYRANPISVLYLWQPGYEVWVGLVTGLTYALWRIGKSPTPGRNCRTLMAGIFPSVVIFLVAVATLDQFGTGGRLRPGMKSPSLQLVDLDGNPTSLTALCGHPIVLNVWATWCFACQQEIPLLNRVARDQKTTGLVEIGVDVAEPASAVRSFMKHVPLLYPVWLDPEEHAGKPAASPTSALLKSVGGIALPTTIFIDKKGIIRSVVVGELVPSTLAIALGEIGTGVSPGRVTPISENSGTEVRERC